MHAADHDGAPRDGRAALPLKALRDIAAVLDRAETLDPETAVRGWVGEQRVTVALKEKQRGDLDLRWTEVIVPVPGGIRINASIRPITSQDRREIERGLTVAHRTGDAAFDAAFVVEGAPDRLIREIVDDEGVRRDLLALAPENVLTTEAGWVVHLHHWVEDPAEAAVAVRLGARIGDITAEIARRQRADVGRLDTSGFRGALAPGTRARDDEQLAELERRMAMRQAHRRRAAIRLAAIILTALVAAGVALALFGGK